MDDMDCAHARRLIDAAVDGELDIISQMNFDAHLADCPTCAAAHATRLAMVRRLRDETQRFAMPAALRERLVSALPGNDASAAAPVRSAPRWRRSWLAGGAWAASIGALATSLAMVLSVPGQQDELVHDLVAAHVRSLMPDHLTDVPSSDRHTVKPWFNGRVAMSPPVPNLADQGFPLIGGRLDYVDEHTAAVLVYKRNQHVINLFVWPAPPGDHPQAPRTDRRNGYNLMEWAQDGMRYSAVSDVNLPELASFQRLWAAAAEGKDNAPSP